MCKFSLLAILSVTNGLPLGEFININLLGRNLKTQKFSQRGTHLSCHILTKAPTTPLLGCSSPLCIWLEIFIASADEQAKVYAFFC